MLSLTTKNLIMHIFHLELRSEEDEKIRIVIPSYKYINYSAAVVISLSEIMLNICELFYEDLNQKCVGTLV